MLVAMVRYSCVYFSTLVSTNYVASYGKILMCVFFQ